MSLHAVGGLCNRLRALLGWYAVNRGAGTLHVVWQPNEYVSGARFLDVFEPIPGVEFSDAGRWSVEAWGPPSYAPEGWEYGFRLLRPVPSIMSRVVDYDKAIHVRRTDHLPDTATHGGDVELLSDWVRWAWQWPDETCYIATDNGETQAELLKAIPRSLVGAPLGGAEQQGLTDHRRNGTLGDAVVDLWTCSRAGRFLGTRHSTFTTTIETLRRLRREGAVP